MDLQSELTALRERNKRVEADKAWETSLFRKWLISSFIYIMIAVFFWIARFPNPWLNALVPTIGFFLSTLTMPVFKKWWLRYFYKRNS